MRKKTRKKAKKTVEDAAELDPKMRRALAIVAARGIPGATNQSVADAIGVSKSTVESTMARARKGRLQPARGAVKPPLDAALAGAPQEVTAQVATVVETAVTHAISWCGDVNRVGRKAVKFLEDALDAKDGLSPTNHNHVRVVGEAILRVLAEVLRLNYLMSSQNAEKDGTLRSEIARMNDEELAKEAKKALQILN